MSEPKRPSPALAATVVRVACLWLLAGALFKLLAGSPNDLPPTVREIFALLGAAVTFKLAVSVELVIGLLALAVPRLGWPLLLVQFLVFLAVLLPLILAGESSCGCFGSSVTIPPAVMFAVDGGLILAILLTRPWRALRRPETEGTRALAVPLVLLLAAAAAAPWYWIRTTVVRPGKTRAQPVASGTSGSPGPTAGAPAAANDAGGPSSPTGSAADPGGEESLATTAYAAWAPPEPLPRFTELDPESWVGQSVWDTDLHVWVDTEQLFPDATWILWRKSCDHCAEHLRELAASFDGTPYVLLRIPDDPDSEPVVHERPPAVQDLDLVEGPDYVVQTPWELRVVGGVVESANGSF